MESTKVVFLWHMHQPYYKHPDKPYYQLPWVRLHGIKDYYGMARIVEKLEKVKVSFNFSGVLLSQIQDYVQNAAKDYYLILSLKDPADLSEQEKKFVIDRFFSINFDRFVRPHRRYLQLFNKKMTPKKKFSDQEIQDLQAIFNLSWLHQFSLEEDKNLKELVLKEKNYSRTDKEYIINKHYQILAQLFPLYNKLLEQGRIELTVTPYYHPIMPLVYDTDITGEFSYLKRPITRFSSPHDCHWQLKKSKEVFKNIFGRTVHGSWPSEGSVSEDIVPVYQEEGFKWIGADEGILFKSLTTGGVTYDLIKNQRHLIYRPYNFDGLNIFFRDRNLSDTISFTYQGWEDPVFAANDLLEHFKRIHYYTKAFFKDNVISIIMDGENAWEYYKNNGVEFLETIYSALEKSEIISSATPSEILNTLPAKELPKLSCGSWINSDFGVWVGSKKNNFYWSILSKLKWLLDKSKHKDEQTAKARDYLYLLEGSDWFWWNTFKDKSQEFKKIFLAYVGKIFMLLGKKPPSYLKKF